MIEIKNTKVYVVLNRFGCKRRYLTKSAAINAAVEAIIYKIHPLEFYHGEIGDYGGVGPCEWVDIKIDRPDYYKRKYDKLTAIIKAKMIGL